MRIRTKELVRKFDQHDIRSGKLKENIYLEYRRKIMWRVDVLYACDNLYDYFPAGARPDYNWWDQRQVHMPKKWRIPKQVFEADRIQYICFHIIRHGKGLKVVRLKNVKAVTRITLRKGKK